MSPSGANKKGAGKAFKVLSTDYHLRLRHALSGEKSEKLLKERLRLTSG